MKNKEGSEMSVRLYAATDVSEPFAVYSTVTLFAKFLGLSTSFPL